MERMNVVELRGSLSEVLNRAEYRNERIVIHRRDKDAAAIIPMEDLRLLERLIREEEDRVDLAAALAAREESSETISLSDLCDKLGVRHGEASVEQSLPRQTSTRRRTRPAKASNKESS